MEISWVGAASNYFGALILPQDSVNAGKKGDADFINSVVAHGVNLDSGYVTDHGPLEPGCGGDIGKMNRFSIWDF